MPDEQPPTQRPGPPSALSPAPERAATAPTAVGEDPGFDQILERLRQVVGRLEQGNLSLEQSLQMFEEGVKLSRRGSEILDAAERRVEVLVKGDDGSDRARPYAVGEGDGRP